MHPSRGPAPSPPESLVILPGRDGWRHALLGADGSITCGALRVPADASAEAARGSAASLVTALAREWHGRDVEIRWSGPSPTGAWTGTVTDLG